jgi:nucleoside-diphosphate-sugar epimerase
MRALERVTAKQFVLISTVDVYPRPIEVDEGEVLDRAGGQPYGRHRLLLEDFVRAHFPEALIVRLPGLFGPGLKKNVVYDFLRDNRLDLVHQDGVFQFYDLSTILADVRTALDAGLRLVNFATEPVGVREVAREAFGREFTNSLPPPGPRYDFRTRHARAFGRTGHYLRAKREVLDALKRFVAAEQAARA